MSVTKKVRKKRVKKETVAMGYACLTCLNRNRVAKIVNGECVTCKSGNRISEVVSS